MRASKCELADLDFRHLQQREEHWTIVDLVGKSGHIRTVPVPEWVKATVDIWTTAAGYSTRPNSALPNWLRSTFTAHARSGAIPPAENQRIRGAVNDRIGIEP